MDRTWKGWDRGVRPCAGSRRLNDSTNQDRHCPPPESLEEQVPDLLAQAGTLAHAKLRDSPSV